MRNRIWGPRYCPLFHSHDQRCWVRHGIRLETRFGLPSVPEVATETDQRCAHVQSGCGVPRSSRIRHVQIVGVHGISAGKAQVQRNETNHWRPWSGWQHWGIRMCLVRCVNGSGQDASHGEISQERMNILGLHVSGSHGVRFRKRKLGFRLRNPMRSGKTLSSAFRGTLFPKQLRN